MSTIIFIRHVETAMSGRFCGHSDPEPNLRGKRQIVSLLEKVESLGIARIYSSDLCRAAQTAAELGRRIGIDVELRAGLREINFGHWEGLSWEEIENQFPTEAKRWIKEFPLRTVPGGETYVNFRARVESELTPFLNETGDRTTAVVTHRGVMQYALRRFFGVPETHAWERTAPHGVVIIATCNDSRWKILP